MMGTAKRSVSHTLFMNRLSTAKRVTVVKALVESCSIVACLDS